MTVIAANVHSCSLGVRRCPTTSLTQRSTPASRARVCVYMERASEQIRQLRSSFTTTLAHRGEVKADAWNHAPAAAKAESEHAVRHLPASQPAGLAARHACPAPTGARLRTGPSVFSLLPLTTLAGEHLSTYYVRGVAERAGTRW